MSGSNSSNRKLNNELKKIVVEVKRLLERIKIIECALAESIQEEDELQVGDEVHSINKPFHDGVIIRFSKNREFAFLLTKGGKEVSKSPKYLNKGKRENRHG